MSDDYVVLGPPDSDLCQWCLDVLERICAYLGVPLAPAKKEGPTCIFLGILIDTLRGELSLPQEKLDRLLASVGQWESKNFCTRKELETLIGTL